MNSWSRISITPPIALAKAAISSARSSLWGNALFSSSVESSPRSIFSVSSVRVSNIVNAPNECACLNQDLQDFRIFRIWGGWLSYPHLHSDLSGRRSYLYGEA